VLTRLRSAFIALLALAVTTIVVPSSPAQAATATGNPGFTANVMAPLHVTDWAAFNTQLQTTKEYGADAVSVDVWWGQVETADQAFDWSYYDQVFSAIKAKGLKIVPIFSFHQCGGNVGDQCAIGVPGWVWSKYNGQSLNGVTLDANGLKHKSEQGNYSSETVQGWADQLVKGEYTAFASAFKTKYATSYASDLQEINVSLGPAGELRYPSYNSHDSGTGYPTRGALQAYSPLALASFRTAMIAKYTNLAGVNAAWGTSLTNISQITPPTDGTNFFTSGAYRTTTYGKDFIDWYNNSLVSHGKTMLEAVLSGLGTSFATAAIGYKIPGVHWAMTNPSYPRAAEVAAGLVQTSIDMNADATGHGYQKIVNLAKQISTTRKVILHFTCLEMSNANAAPAYSQAQDLVFWVAAKAAALGVTIKGENALSGGVTTNAGWDNIVNAFDWASYTGMTVLRMGDVTSGVGLERFAKFIARYRLSATVHFAEFASATSYTMHPFNGLTGDRVMSYEGYFNGRHWWKVTVANPPNFTFCFLNSNGTWDGTNRVFNKQGTQLYVLPYSANVAVTRP